MEPIIVEYPQLLHTAIDTTDARALAEFYRQLLGLQYRQGDEPPADGQEDDVDWLVLVDPNGARENVPSFVELRWRPGEHQAALTS